MLQVTHQRRHFQCETCTNYSCSEDLGNVSSTTHSLPTFLLHPLRPSPFDKYFPIKYNQVLKFCFFQVSLSQNCTSKFWRNRTCWNYTELLAVFPHLVHCQYEESLVRWLCDQAKREARRSDNNQGPEPSSCCEREYGTRQMMWRGGAYVSRAIREFPSDPAARGPSPPLI